MNKHLARIVTLTAVLWILPLSWAFAGDNAWTVSGPPGGLFEKLLISPTNANTYYAAYGSTVFYTTDGAMTWQSHDFNQQIGDIAVDPTDGTRIYVAALSDGLFRSDDGGKTFTRIAPGNTLVWSVGVGGSDGKTVYYATGNGSFYQSTDRGQTFTARASTLPTLTQLRVEGANGLTVLAAHGSQIAKSVDGGATWGTEIAIDGNNFIQSYTRLGSGLLVAVMNSGVFTSPDGVTWTRILGGTFVAVATDPDVPDAFVAANVGGGQLWRFTNNGASFNTFGAVPLLGDPHGMIVSSASDRLVLANGLGVAVGPVNGAGWTDKSKGLYAATAVRMASTLAANAKIYAYSYFSGPSGLFTYDASVGWTRANLNAAQALTPSKPLGQASIAVKPGKPDTIYIAAFDIGVFRSDDAGATWSGPGTGLTGLAPGPMAFDPVDPNVMYTSVAPASSPTPPSALYMSTDGGATWAPRSVDLPSAYGLHLAVQPDDGNKMFLGATTGITGTGAAGLYRSVDAGVHWTLAAFPNQLVNDVVFDPADSSRVYASVSSSGLNSSTDGGAHFTPNAALSALINGQSLTSIAIDPVIPTTIYVATAGDNSDAFSPPKSAFILRSVDRGQTWEKLRVATDLPAWFVNDLTLDPNNPTIVYATTGGHGVGAFEVVNDLAVSMSGHSGVKPKGVSSSFDVSVQNNGAYSATGVRLTIQLPAGLTNVTATTPTGSCTVATNSIHCDVPVIAKAQSSAVHVSYTPPGEMALPISASVTAHERDSAAENNSAQATANAGELVDLRVTLTPSATSVNTGAAITFTLQVTNTGPVASSAATMVFAIANSLTFGASPPCPVFANGATCTLGPLAVNASQTFTFTASSSTAGSYPANVTLTAATTATDPDTSNNTAQTTVTVTTPPPATSSGGGGGGALDYLTLLALALFFVVVRTMPQGRGALVIRRNPASPVAWRRSRTSTGSG